MPGLVAMDDGAPNGARTNHEKDQANGTGSAMVDGHRAAGKPGAQEPGKSGMMNGGEVQNPAGPAGDRVGASSVVNRMNDLPDEIDHITQSYIPISKLLARLSQRTHNVLETTIEQLARMPLPHPSASTVNGNAGAIKGGDDHDVSGESVQKKVAFLNFLQTYRGKWIKALVITNWSRNSPDVSKLIDLNCFLQAQMIAYQARVDELVELKRGLHEARVPRPDLKTAYEVLSSGKADWMPDVRLALSLPGRSRPLTDGSYTLSILQT
jgi:mediator of RNA polymerase II transcription subunit 14